MSSILEEKLREAACNGDVEATLELIFQKVDVNSKNAVNGWSALHWAAKRGHDNVVAILLKHGANARIENNKGELPIQLTTNPIVSNLLIGIGDSPALPPASTTSSSLTPYYIRNPPLNGHIADFTKIRAKHADFSAMPTTTLPAAQNDELVVSVRVAGADPDFIEIEIPRWKLTYLGLLKICCDELEVSEFQVERIRKLPNTRLRKDSDVKRLTDFQCLELVLKANSNDKSSSNCYQSISSCKNQTILY